MATTIADVQSYIDNYIRDNTSGAVRPAEMRAVLSKMLEVVVPGGSGAFFNGGNIFAGNSSIGNNDNFDLALKTNNLNRIYIHENGRVSVAHTADNGYDFDVSGIIALNNRIQFRMDQVKIRAGANSANILITDNAGSLPDTSNRNINIGTGNNASSHSTLTDAYLIMLGYANTSNGGAAGKHCIGNFITNNSPYGLCHGSSIVSTGFYNVVMGHSIVVNHAGTIQNTGAIAIGNNINITHFQSSAIGSNQSSTDLYEMHIATQSGNVSDGWRNYYLGTGKVRVSAAAPYTNHVYLHGSGGGAVNDSIAGNIGLAGGAGYGQGVGGDVVFATAASLGVTNSTRQSLVDRWKIKWNTGYLSNIAVPTDMLHFDGNLHLNTAGNKIKIKSGTNGAVGNATLVAGTVTVACTSATANSLIMLSRKTPGGTVGNLSYSVTAGTSFTINSDNALDTSVVSYHIIDAM